MLQHVSLEVRADQVDACVGFWELLDPAGNLVEVMSAVPEPPWPEE